MGVCINTHIGSMFLPIAALLTTTVLCEEEWNWNIMGNFKQPLYSEFGLRPLNIIIKFVHPMFFIICLLPLVIFGKTQRSMLAVDGCFLLSLHVLRDIMDFSNWNTLRISVILGLIVLVVSHINSIRRVMVSIGGSYVFCFIILSFFGVSSAAIILLSIIIVTILFVMLGRKKEVLHHSMVQAAILTTNLIAFLEQLRIIRFFDELERKNIFDSSFRFILNYSTFFVAYAIIFVYTFMFDKVRRMLGF